MKKFAPALLLLPLLLAAPRSAPVVAEEPPALAPYTPTRLEWAALHAQALWGGELFGGAYVVDYVALADRSRIHVEVTLDREAGGRPSGARELMQQRTQLLLRYLESRGWDDAIKLGGEVKARYR